MTFAMPNCCFFVHILSYFANSSRFETKQNEGILQSVLRFVRLFAVSGAKLRARLRLQVEREFLLDVLDPLRVPFFKRREKEKKGREDKGRKKERTKKEKRR